MWGAAPSRFCFKASASARGKSRTLEMAAVMVSPPSAIVLTKWGTPFSWTATVVRSAPTEMIASGPSIAVSVSKRARIIAEEVGSTLTGVSPAAVAISTRGSTRSR